MDLKLSGHIARSILLVFALFGSASCAERGDIQAGRFVYRSEPNDVEFEIQLPGGMLGQPVEIPFLANSISGVASSVTFEGKIHGIPAEGVWSVSFSDSFGNTGKGTILLRPGLVLLTLRLEKIADPRCSRFYGSMRLAKEG